MIYDFDNFNIASTIDKDYGFMISYSGRKKSKSTTKRCYFLVN